jgi:glycosyltransferase involved in cell wall biosynthesis
MRLSVVIPCLNEERTIGGQLDALAAQSWSEPWEVIVADNGSTDGTVAVAETYRGRIEHLRIVDAGAVRGAAYALNVGCDAARGEAVALCDADDVVAPDWVRSMGEALRRHDVVACRQDYVTLNPHWIRAARANVFEHGLPSVTFAPDLRHAGAGGLGFLRRHHVAIGGFDTTLAAVFDTDYCIRLQLQLGLQIVYLPDTVVHVRLRSTPRHAFKQAYSYSVWNGLLAKRYSQIPPTGTRWLRWLVSGWRPLVAVAPRVITRSGRFALAWRLGWMLGRYTGGVRFRALEVW